MLGRGRGRGRGIAGPVARDDEGNMLDAAGPPPLFPDITLPDHPVHSDSRIEQLRLEQAKLTRHWRASPYNLDKAYKADEVPAVARVERWSDRQSQKQNKLPLAQIMFLTPTYFPMELYSKADKILSASAGASRARARLLAGSANETEEEKKKREVEFVKLIEREKAMSQAKATMRASGSGEGPKKAEDDDEEEEEEADEPDEDDFVDDDYLQHGQVDDDEGYDDEFAEDGENEAYF